MFGSVMLDVAIGLFLLYFVLSTVCSAINEAIAALLSRRARTLEEGVRAMLSDPQGQGLASAFIEHPLIKSLMRPGSNHWPSYIPSHLFAMTLMDIVVPSTESMTLDEIREAIARIPDDDPLINRDIKRSVLLFVTQAENDVNKARESLEKWFDNVMERTSGWYKRQQWRNILIISAVLTTLLNADTFMIGSLLARDQTVRAAVVAAADDRLQQPRLDGSTQTGIDRARSEIEALGSLGLPLGWSGVFLPWSPVPTDARPLPTDVPGGFGEWIQKLLGLLVTAAALSFGAPFWFDMLNKASNLRAAGQPPAKTAESPEASPS